MTELNSENVPLLGPIPPLVHSMWLDKDPNKWTEENPPSNVRHYRDSFVKHNPQGYEFMFWNYDRVLTFFHTHPESKRFLPMFERIEPWISKCDVARCAILYEYGGIYADLDYECLKPLDPLLKGKSLILSRDLDQPLLNPDILSNGLMGASPKHPFFFHALESMENRQSYFAVGYRLSPVNTVMWKSGPKGLFYDYKTFFDNPSHNHIREPLTHPCDVHPLQVTIWDRIKQKLFPSIPIKEHKYKWCENREAYTTSHKLQGTNWGTSLIDGFIPSKGIIQQESRTKQERPTQVP